MLPTLKGLKGFKAVQRIVCGGCHDFKESGNPSPRCVSPLARRHASHGLAPTQAQVITSLSADDFGGWEAAGFAPEADFLAKLNGINGISSVETQTFTLMPQ